MRTRPPRARVGRRRRRQSSLVRWLGALALASSSSATADGLVVVSQNNQKILRYDEANGSFLDVFVEPVTEGFRIPAGIALRPGAGSLYVSSAGSGEIWRYETATGQALGPAVASGLLQPGGAAFDAAGDFLYFVDLADGLSVTRDAVKRLRIASGAVTTVGIEASAEFAHVALDGADVYASDALGGRIVRFPASGGSGAVQFGGLSAPGALLFRAPGDLLVAETGSDRVLEYVFAGGAWTLQRVVLEAAAGVDGPAGLALAPDGALSVSGEFSNQVVRVDLATLAVSQLVPSAGSPLQDAGSAVWSGSTLLVASLAANAVVYFDAAGRATGVEARGISPPVDRGLTLSPSETLVVASSLNNDLIEYDVRGGGVVRQFFDACPSSLDAPYDAVFGADGHLYVSCQFSNAVHRFDASSGDPLGFFVLSGAGGLFFPQGLAFGPNGNLFVASRGTNEILEYDGASGAFVAPFVAAANGGVSPVDVLFRGDTLYVSFAGSDEVRAFDAGSGAPLAPFVTPGSGGLDAPAGLAFGPNGNLFVASLGTHEVLEYDGASGAFVSSFVAANSGGLDGPVDLAFTAPPASPIPSLPLGFWGATCAAFCGVGARALRAVRRVE